jgi:hypothetical protein
MIILPLKRSNGICLKARVEVIPSRKTPADLLSEESLDRNMEGGSKAGHNGDIRRAAVVYVSLLTSH